MPPLTCYLRPEDVFFVHCYGIGVWHKHGSRAHWARLTGGLPQHREGLAVLEVPEVRNRATPFFEKKILLEMLSSGGSWPIRHKKQTSPKKQVSMVPKVEVGSIVGP